MGPVVVLAFAILDVPVPLGVPPFGSGGQVILWGATLPDVPGDLGVLPGVFAVPQDVTLAGVDVDHPVSSTVGVNPTGADRQNFTPVPFVHGPDDLAKSQPLDLAVDQQGRHEQLGALVRRDDVDQVERRGDRDPEVSCYQTQVERQVRVVPDRFGRGSGHADNPGLLGQGQEFGGPGRFG